MKINHPSPLPPLTFLAGQLIVLLIGSCRLELTARSGDLPQRLALPEMIAFQMAIAAMAFSTVLNSATIVGSGVFLHLAALLNGTPAATEGLVISAVVLWMIALQESSQLLQRDETRSIIRSLLSTAVIGLPLAEYLIADFSDAHARWVDPISVVVRQSFLNRPGISALIQAGLCVALIIFSRSRRKLRGA